jgi:hypothetical protein
MADWLSTLLKRLTKFREECLEPHCLLPNMVGSNILCFSGGKGNSGLEFAGPADWASANKKTHSLKSSNQCPDNHHSQSHCILGVEQR